MLRPYQIEAIGAARRELARNSGCLIQIPTGGGKSLVMAKIAEAAKAKGGRTLIVAHRRRLIRQMAKTLASIGLHPSIDMAGEKGSLLADVVVASVQTLASKKRRDRYPAGHFKLIMVDEAHHYADGKLTAAIQHFGGKVVGFTATPNRADRKAITGLFPVLAYEIPLVELIDSGYLAPITIKSVPLCIDISGVHQSKGDFDETELDATIRPYLRKAAQALLEHAPGRKTIAFLPLVATSREFAQICREHGLRADYISGACPIERQDEIQEQFARGELDVLANAQILTEGVDLPICDCVLPLRPTKSQPMFSQMVGRGTRLSPGKTDLLLLDPMFLHERINLMEPANLTATSDRHQKKIREFLDKGDDLKVATKKAEASIIEEDAEKAKRRAETEARLAQQLEDHGSRESKGIKTLNDLVPLFGKEITRHYDRQQWQRDEPSAQQLECLRKAGYPLELVTSKGLAAHLITHMHKRRERKLCTLNQFKVLAKTGHHDPANASFDEASRWIEELKKKA